MAAFILCFMVMPAAGHDPVGDIVSIVPNRGHQGTTVEITMKVKNRDVFEEWDRLEFVFPENRAVDPQLFARDRKTPDPTIYIATIDIPADAIIGDRNVQLNSA